MKKAMKKLMAALLAVAMVCAMVAPAFADDGSTTAAAATGTGSITINNAVPNQTYTIYRILELEYHAGTSSYLYKVTPEWKSFVQAHPSDLKLDDSTGVVTWANPNTNNDSDVIQTLANDAGDYAKNPTNNVPVAGSKKATGITLTFSNLSLGWYLVVSDLDNGAICSIGTTDPNAEINEKNSKPTIEKEVYEGSNSGYSNDAGIGDTVNFHTNIYVTDGNPTNYILHDTMTKGLKFDSTSVKVYLHRDRAGSANIFSNYLTADTDYELVTSTSDKCTFEIKFLKPLMPYDSIQVTYSATVTADAEIGTTGNDNDTVLEYGNKNYTEHSSTKTYVWEMGVHKFTKINNVDTPLENAEFQLYKKDGENKQYAKFAETGTNTSIYKLTGWTGNAEEAATKVKTPANGNIKFEGLDAGTYYLEETDAPEGYNTLTAPIEVIIERTLPKDSAEAATFGGQAIKYGQTNATTGTDHLVPVENNRGTTLPGTGGIGTTIFYVVGGGLMVAAAILLITKKRMENR